MTAVETLPLLATELGLSTEINFLTALTLNGTIPFDVSFRLRYSLLKQIPSKKIAEIMSKVPISVEIEKFIREHRSECVIITGNLDRWIEPIAARLGCEIFSSTVENGRLNVLDKGAVIRRLKKTVDPVIAVGESFNDVSMMAAADVAIAFGGVHRPIDAAVSSTDYVVFDGATLCRLLNIL